MRVRFAAMIMLAVLSCAASVLGGAAGTFFLLVSQSESAVAAFLAAMAFAGVLASGALAIAEAEGRAAAAPAKSDDDGPLARLGRAHLDDHLDLLRKGRAR